MSTCPEVHELATAGGLPEGHPLRRHLRDCARCRASLRALEVFLDPTEDPAISSADVAQAQARMFGLVQELVAGGDAFPPESRPRLPRRATRVRNWMAAAAVLLAAVGLWQVGPKLLQEPDVDPQALRGESVAPGDEFQPTFRTESDGALYLQWAAVEGADDYVVVLWNEALEEQTRLEVGTSTRSAIDASTAWVTVIARQAGQEFLRSSPMRVP